MHARRPEDEQDSGTSAGVAMKRRVWSKGTMCMWAGTRPNWAERSANIRGNERKLMSAAQGVGPKSGMGCIIEF
jgi:hypothetical protein